MSLTSIIERRKAQNRYFDTQGPAYAISQRLHTTDDPSKRADLLDALADVEDKLAELHPVAFGPDPNEDEGGRDLAGSLASSADLLRRLADTERAVATAEWTTACDLKDGDRIWRDDGWAKIWKVTTGTGLVPRIVHAHLSEQGPTLVFGEYDLLRTGGSPITVGVILVSFHREGMAAEELLLWAELAVTANREARAGLIDQIWQYAAERVGGQAAESLARMATAERALAVGDVVGAPNPQVRSRRAIAVFFFILGAVIITVPHSLPMWAVIVLGVALAGPLLNLIISAARFRPDWSAAWTCEQTGERLTSAAHRRAHTHARRCRPASRRILPRIMRRTDTTT